MKMSERIANIIASRQNHPFAAHGLYPYLVPREMKDVSGTL